MKGGKTKNMSYEEYSKAQKMGAKAFKASIASGTCPYLPVLDEILSNVDIDGEVRLGAQDILLDQVVGTSTFGRTQAFASNFMPLLSDVSEFSSKWARLATAQLEEGIHDAVKVYEYMNKYYVVEGNKRVSVLKYFNSPTIYADVTRKIPKRTDDLENRIYYEYMDFYELTQINYVLFSKLGCYTRLLTAAGKSTSDVWTADDRKDFAFFYAQFSKVFKEKGGHHLNNVTIGDALLFYLELYPYEESKDASISDIRDKLDKIWQEILLLGEDDSVELLMDPATEKNTVSSVIHKIKSPRRRRVAFVYDKEPSSSDWIYGHELGRLHLDDAFGDAIETRTYITDLETDDTDELFEQIYEDNCDIIFAVTPKLIQACLKAAVAHPDIIILNCALNSSYNTVRTYYTRMYEAKFLTGMIAGAVSTNNKVGYIADYPLYGAAASINAFALGAKMVNPYAKVYLAWSTLQNADVDGYFKKHDVKYISAQDMITPQNNIRQFGLYEETEYGKKNLAMSIYDWGVFYEKLIKSIQRGSWKTGESVESKAINYWWGLSAGVIDVICSNNLPAGTVKLVELMKTAISAGSFHPFTGPLTDQEGIIRYESEETILPDDIMLMDWLVDNVVGHIPTLDELKEEARPVVMLRGLDSAIADKGGNTLP